MKFSIAERLKPFSHTPGSMCVIPGTCSEIQAFPTLLRIDDFEVKLQVTGPVADFTLQQDLERGVIYVFGKAKEGYFKIRIEASNGGFHIIPEKGKALTERVDVEAEVEFVAEAPLERLSLGNHKAQDWDEVQKRCDLKEYFPVLFCLGQKLPRISPQPLTGTARLLEGPEDRTQLELAFQSLFRAAFTKILIPRLIDDQHQGLAPEEPVKGKRHFLIQEAAKAIRALFFKQNERRIAFLPQLPICLDSGRMMNIQAPGIGQIDIEWTKKTLRRAVLRACTTGEVILELQKQIQSFRVRTSLREKGKRQMATDPLLLVEGKTFYLDQFKK